MGGGRRRRAPHQYSQSEAVPGFLPGDCARAPRERRQCPATNLTPGALSRGLGSSHRCRLASGPALCRQAPVLRWPTQAPSASEVAPLRATRKVWCISRNVLPRWDLCLEKGSRAAPGPRTGPRGGCLVVQSGATGKDLAPKSSGLHQHHEAAGSLRGPAEILRFPERRL